MTMRRALVTGGSGALGAAICAVFTLGTFVRHDDYNYYPSNDAFADLGPPSLQRQ